MELLSNFGNFCQLFECGSDCGLLNEVDVEELVTFEAFVAPRLEIQSNLDVTMSIPFQLTFRVKKQNQIKVLRFLI